MKLFALLDTQYNKFVNSVKTYLSKSLSGHSVNYGSNTIFGQIVTIVGNAIQNIMLYIEDALVEQNKYTAQRKKSIYGLAALSGYMPSYGKAAITNVKLDFVLNNEKAYNVILNNKETFTCTQNGLNYNVILPQEAITLNVAQNNSTKHFTLVQGKFETQRFVSNGGQYYTINFKFLGNLDLDYLTVKVNNEIWNYVPSLYDMSPNSKEYTYKNSINGGIDLIFGNETHGRALLVGDVIDIEYLIHDGDQGNLNPDIETQFVFNNQLMDINGDLYDGNLLFVITFSEKDPISSGSNSETIDHVKEMIGLNSRSLVLASPENYRTVISKFGFCGYSRTWSDPNSLTVNSLIMKNFKSDLTTGNDYFSLKEEDFFLTDFQKSTIYDYINNTGGQLAALNYKIFDPQLCKYAMHIYIKLKSDKYNKILIKNQIRSLVGEFFSDVQSDIFIPKSDIIHLLKTNIEGIDGVEVYILSERNEHAIYTKQYTEDTYVINKLTGQYVRKTENVRLYDGENPNLGLDEHGNIYLKSNAQFPVIMGGWKYINDEGQEVQITDPLIISFIE